MWVGAEAAASRSHLKYPFTHDIYGIGDRLGIAYSNYACFGDSSYYP